MALESATYINDLAAANPVGTDPKSQGDDHIRLIKQVLKNSFLNLSGAILVGGTDSGAANAYVLAVTLNAYATNMIVMIKAINANTGASTLNINGLGAKSILRQDGTALQSGDIVAGQWIELVYSGTDFRLLNQFINFASPPAIGSGTPQAVTGTIVTATTQFVGSGAGLTGTANSLSIGGNASTATTAASCSGNAASATTAASCSGNSATATSSGTATNLAGGGAGQIPYQSASGATAMLAAGTAGQSLVSNGAAAPSWGSGVVSAAAVNTTSGTAIDFTNIPSWAKRITVMFSAVSTNGTSIKTLRVGTSSGITTSGYLSGAFHGSSAGMSSISNSEFVLNVPYNNTAPDSLHGAVVLSQINVNTWVLHGALHAPVYTVGCSICGSVTISGTLDRIRLTTVNGTDTFDAGSVNITWE